MSQPQNRRTPPPTPLPAAREDKRVPLGGMFMTPGVRADVPLEELLRALGRHARGDWGDVCVEDAAANERALLEGERLLSSYRTAAGIKFWLITEWDRSRTTGLLPDEY